MTAFSRQEVSTERGDWVIELRSVNHRYLDVFLRLPEEIRSLETRMREQISHRLSRGKVECSLRFKPGVEAEDALSLNEERIRHIAHASRHIDSFIYNPAPISSLDVLKMPGVIQSKELDLAALEGDVADLLKTALDDLLATREREGEKLAEMLFTRCDAMDEIIKEVNARMPEILLEWQTRLVKRLKDAELELDKDRLEQEIVLLANKTDVTEEMDRLAMHIIEVRRVLKQDNPVGRRLDFLMQELNREANTLASKSIHTDSTGASVDLKVLIEQMREQIQNIE
jgi:uncharacterized protein (TIGR00255 family)